MKEEMKKVIEKPYDNFEKVIEDLIIRKSEYEEMSREVRAKDDAIRYKGISEGIQVAIGALNKFTHPQD